MISYNSCCYIDDYPLFASHLKHVMLNQPHVGKHQILKQCSKLHLVFGRQKATYLKVWWPFQNLGRHEQNLGHYM